MKVFDIVPCDRPFSFYRSFIDRLGERAHAPAHRLCAMLRVQTLGRHLPAERPLAMVVETCGEPEDEFGLQDELAALRTRLGRFGPTPDFRVQRLTFFACEAPRAFGRDKKGDSLDADARHAKGVAEVARFPGNSLLASLDVVEWDGRMATTYIYAAVIGPPAWTHEMYIYTLGTFNVKVGERLFEIKGTFYCQQNSKTSVCGHAALRCAINNHRAGRGDEPISCEDINRLLRIDHVHGWIGDAVSGREEDRQGLVLWQAQEVLLHHGFHSQVVRLKDEASAKEPEKVKRDALLTIHASLDSGMTAFLVFETDPSDLRAAARPRFWQRILSGLPFRSPRPTAGGDFHILAVVGHTMNPDLWSPEARLGYFHRAARRDFRFYDSTEWVDCLVLQDDNYGACYTLPLDYLLPRVRYAIGTFPFDSMIAPIKATDRAMTIIDECLPILERQPHILSGLYKDCPPERVDSAVYWLRKLREAVDRPSGDAPRFTAPVLRTVQVARDDYLNHLRHHGSWDPRVPFVEGVLRRMECLLPDAFWLTEFSLPHLYTARKRVLGEVIHRLDAPQQADAARLPGDLGAGVPLMRLPGAFITGDPAGGRLRYCYRAVHDHSKVFDFRR